MDLKDHQELRLNLPLLETKAWLVRMESLADSEDPVFQVTWDCVADLDYPDCTDLKEKLVTEVYLVSMPLSDLKGSLAREALLVCLVLLVRLVKTVYLVLLVSKVLRVTRARLVCRVTQASMERRVILVYPVLSVYPVFPDLIQ
jgi:hypothetical protein